MKPHLPLLLLSSLLAALSASAVSTSYLADGVDTADLAHSERFYDVGKGYYWTWPADTPYLGAQGLYNETGRNFDFLGELAPRITGTAMRTSAFEQLKNDGNTCGYQVPANQIQYWLSYYGMFYTGTEPLAYGLTYSNEYLERLGGTQSLSVGMLFYDYWQDSGNNLAIVGEWYFNGTPDDLLRNPTVSSGGYFADYFNDQGAVIYLNFTDEVIHANDCPLGVRSFTHELAKAFALEEEADGTYSSLHPGQVAYLGLVADGKNAGHALTCYGFETDERGMLRSLKVTNSDDKAFALLTLYVKEDSRGYLYLYKDAACTDLWEYSSSNWYIQGLEYINTPEHLVDLYHLYNAEDTPLTWNGEKTIWSEQDTGTATLERLPKASDGWDVFAGDGYYRSYYHEGRPVLFDDHASSGTVGLDGALTAPKVTIDNSAKAYTFTGTEGTTLSTPELVKSGTNTATFTGVDITAAQVEVGTGKLLLGQNASLGINSQVVIKALGSESAAGMYSTNGNQTYSLGNSSITIENAVVDYIANTAGTLSNLLSNVKLVNNSTATLTENNSQNKSGISAHAAKGSIQFLNKGTEGITLKDAIIGTDLSLSVYKGTTVSEAEETALYIQGKLVGLTNSTINANLTMMVGSELDVSRTENTGIKLGSALTFNRGMKLSEADVNAVLGMNEGGAYHLFNSVDSITLASSDYSNWTQAITLADAVDASTYFTNLENGKYYVIYTGVTNGGANVGQVMLMGATVPEPATGTLSLLALAALAARRRRK